MNELHIQNHPILSIVPFSLHPIHKETFEVNNASKKEKALPRLLFQGKFNLSDEKFEQGLQEGQFFQVKDEHGRLMSKEVKKHLQVLGYDKEDTIYVNLHLGLLTFEVLLHESYNFKAYIRTVKL